MVGFLLENFYQFIINVVVLGMNLEDLDPESAIDTISASDDDKKFVRQAVAHVISHVRNGFVPLCASVATLLKEKAVLKDEIESLKQQISETNIEDSSTFQAVNKSKNEEPSLKFTDALQGILVDVAKSFTQKTFKSIKIRAIQDCLCHCCNQESTSNHLYPPLHKGESIVVSGEICGKVCYVGHLENIDYPEIYVGLYLDEAVGDSDGTIGGTRYFFAPQNYGLFVPLFRVLCTMR